MLNPKSRNPQYKKAVIWTANIVLPLGIGLFYYLKYGENTFLQKLLTAGSPPRYMPELVSSYLCDILWSYSLTFALGAVGTSGKGRAVAALSPVLGAVTELLQLSGIFPGTFDPKDILWEVVAFSVAYIFIIVIDRSSKNEKIHKSY